MYCECEYADGQIPLLFIINPAAHSGMGIRVWKEAEKVLKERGIPYEAHFSEKKGEVKALAHHLTALSEQEERFLIVAGGDGTLNEALQGIQDFEQIRLGYLPTLFRSISRRVPAMIWRGIFSFRVRQSSSLSGFWIMERSGAWILDACTGWKGKRPKSGISR